ncbi:DUF5990 family protein [Streptomyces sp. GESEQ-35]|uniref:DUF5990 family protein n=1 Tax=Streptomyces sp. GESEQ-35 TaxID=2812657 RepID=UPI001FF10035|nr:DUF5990 family protein [Streptomyces sp. GESEQ-35]
MSCARDATIEDATNGDPGALGEGAVAWSLGLIDACGGPVCARVVPPRITWTARAA